MQDINKCNILLSANFCLNTKKIYKILDINLTQNYLNNGFKKLNKKFVLNAFNFEIINNLNMAKLKQCSKLGNFDVGVLILKQNGGYFVKVCAGNGYMLSLQKKSELFATLNEFDNLTNSQLINFFKREVKKQTVKPLTEKQIRCRKAQINALIKS